MMKRIVVAAALLAVAGPALARPAHHRFSSHRRVAQGRGLPITKGASDVRINAVGEVIAPKIGKITVDGK